MGRAGTVERIISKGQLVPFTFTRTGVAASATNSAMQISDTAADVPEAVIPFDFEVVAVTTSITTARSAGTLTTEATINGTGTGITNVINGQSTTRSRNTSRRGQKIGSAGDRIGARLTTDASFAPVTNNDVAVTVWVLCHLEGI